MHFQPGVHESQKATISTIGVQRYLAINDESQVHHRFMMLSQSALEQINHPRLTNARHDDVDAFRSEQIHAKDDVVEPWAKDQKN